MGTGGALCLSYAPSTAATGDNRVDRAGISMAMDYRRCYQPGGHYFFTVVTEQRQPLLIDHIDRLRTAFRHGMERHPFAIEAIVILPDPLHTLWHLPDGDADFSTRWMVIKRKFSAGLQPGITNASKLRKREKGIWQRRFWEHHIRDEQDWQAHTDITQLTAKPPMPLPSG
jgi:putative transposase